MSFFLTTIPKKGKINSNFQKPKFKVMEYAGGDIRHSYVAPKYVDGLQPLYAGVCGGKNRIFATFIRRINHDSYDGQAYMCWSDDYGKTFSDPVFFYDPATHHKTDYPQYYSDSRATPDLRSGVVFTSHDKTKLICYFHIDVGWNNDVVNHAGRNSQARQVICITFDLDANENIDFSSQTWALVQDGASGGGTHAEKDGVLYSGGFSHVFADGDEGHTLNRSFDMGQTWELYSRVFTNRQNSNANETSIFFKGDMMYASGRPWDQVNGVQYVGRSNDNGLTWAYDKTTSPDWLRGGNVDLLPDGNVLFYATNGEPNKMKVLKEDDNTILDEIPVGVTNSHAYYWKGKIIMISNQNDLTFTMLNYDPINHKIIWGSKPI